MNRPPDLIDKEFVDREPAKNDYQAMIPAGENPRILCFEGVKGMGKSWLLKRLFRDSQTAPCLLALIDCESADAADEEKLLKRIGRDMGGPIQEAMRVEILALAAEQQIHIQAGRDVNIGGDVTLQKVTVNNYGDAEHLTVDVTDMQGRDDRVDALTEGLKKGLNGLVPPQRAVLFLDHYEKATKPARDWLMEELFQKLQSYEIQNLILVVACDPPIDVFSSREWEAVVLSHQLKGMDLDAVKLYWQKRQIPEEGMQFFLPFLFSEGDPSPDEMSRLLTRYKQGLGKNAGGVYAAG